MYSTTHKNNPLKQFIQKAFSLPGLTYPFRLLVRDAAIVFLLHRFRDPENNNSGHDPKTVRSLLAYLRKNNFHLISLQELFQRLLSGESIDRVVVFTMDDGYRDQGIVGGPIFSEFDCPVTMFLTTGFLDREHWLWWDRVDYIFQNTRKKQLAVAVESSPVSYSCADRVARECSRADFVSRCMDISNSERLLAINRLSDAAEVLAPEQAPTQYAPLTWEEVRRCEQRGMIFGPHTVTHPVLARTTATQSEFEISHSWTRLCAEVAYPLPIFCYPNGRTEDFGLREIDSLKLLGFKGAVTAEPGYVRLGTRNDNADRIFSIQRFLMSDNLASLLRCINGVAAVKGIFKQ